jgi:hypothetical protein
VSYRSHHSKLRHYVARAFLRQRPVLYHGHAEPTQAEADACAEEHTEDARRAWVQAFMQLVQWAARK